MPTPRKEWQIVFDPRPNREWTSESERQEALSKAWWKLYEIVHRHALRGEQEKPPDIGRK